MCANKQFLRRRSRALLLLIPLVALSLASCAKIAPRQVDVDLPTDMPEIKETSFDKPLADLGEMTRVYGKRAFIQGKDITDLLDGRDDIDNSMVFISSCQPKPGCMEAIKAGLRKYGKFENIIETHIGTTIGGYSGPGTIGIVFAKKV